jgi:hypothetical protein
MSERNAACELLNRFSPSLPGTGRHSGRESTSPFSTDGSLPSPTIPMKRSPRSEHSTPILSSGIWATYLHCLVRVRPWRMS